MESFGQRSSSRIITIAVWIFQVVHGGPNCTVPGCFTIQEVYCPPVALNKPTCGSVALISSTTQAFAIKETTCASASKASKASTCNATFGNSVVQTFEIKEATCKASPTTSPTCQIPAQPMQSFVINEGRCTNTGRMTCGSYAPNTIKPSTPRPSLPPASTSASSSFSFSDMLAALGSLSSALAAEAMPWSPTTITLAESQAAVSAALAKAGGFGKPCTAAVPLLVVPGFLMVSIPGVVYPADFAVSLSTR